LAFPGRDRRTNPFLANKLQIAHWQSQ
jgi:hypothetical protein